MVSRQFLGWRKKNFFSGVEQYFYNNKDVVKMQGQAFAHMITK